MPVTISGAGTIAGITTGGLPDAIVDTDMIKAGVVQNAHMDTMDASKLTGTLGALAATNLTGLPAARLTGALPALDGSNLTGVGSNILKQQYFNVAWLRASSNSWSNGPTMTYTTVDPDSKINIQLYGTGMGHFWGSSDDDAAYHMRIYRISPSAAELKRSGFYVEYPNDRIDGGGDFTEWSGAPRIYWLPNTIGHCFENPCTSAGDDITFRFDILRCSASVYDMDGSSYWIVTEFT